GSPTKTYHSLGIWVRVRFPTDHSGFVDVPLGARSQIARRTMTFPTDPGRPGTAAHCSRSWGILCSAASRTAPDRDSDVGAPSSSAGCSRGWPITYLP